MPEKVVPGPVSDDLSIREAVCIHTKKIFDSCRDKDCLEDLRVYPTRSSQEILDRAQSVKAGSAELLYAYIDVEPVSFNRGFYTVDVRYFYRVTADAFVGAARPLEVSGLVVADKRVILFGSEGGAKIFSSTVTDEALDPQHLPQTNIPTAVVEAVDPLILSLRLMDVCDCRPCECCCLDVPAVVSTAFGEELMMCNDMHRLFVTLGQFSIIRLERDTQLLIPAYDYCMPTKECSLESGDSQQDPCELFQQVQFPVNEFFPPNTVTSNTVSGCGASCSCCQSCRS